MTPEKEEKEKKSKEAFKQLIMLQAKLSGKLPSQILEEMYHKSMSQQMPENKKKDTSQ